MNGWNKLLENIKNILKKANINNEYEIEYLTTYECEKKLVKNSLVYFHGHIYKVTKIGYIENNKLEPLDEFNFVNGAELVDILNPNNKGIRTFKYLSNGTVYLIKFNNKLKNITESKQKINERYTDYEQYSPLEGAIRKYIDSNMIFNLFSYKDELLNLYGNDKPLTLYRGLNFNNKEDYENFLLSIKSGYYIEHNLSAWTTDERQAKQFSITKPSYMEFMTPENWGEISKQYKNKERITGFIGIILKINIQPKQGIDLKDFSSENEVILTKGKYKILDVKKIFSFNDLLKEKENKLINFFENLDADEYELAIKWLLHNDNKLLYKKDIINYLFDKNSSLLYLLDAQKLSDNIRHKLFLIMLKRIKNYLKTNSKNNIDTFSFDFDKIIKVYFVNIGESGWKMFLDEDIKTFCDIIKPIIKDTIDKVSNFYMKNINEFPQIKWEVYNIKEYFKLSNLENYYNQKIGTLIRQQWNKLQDKKISNELFQINKRNLSKYIERTLKSLTLTESKNNKLKNITESIYYKDLAFNNAFNKFEELIVLKNPSIEWIKNELKKLDLRFIYNPKNDILYVWNGSKWMHSEVIDAVDMNLSSPYIIGVFSPGLIEVWTEISPNDDEDEAIMISKKYAGKLFKSIYPSGYQIIAYS
mgnify:CR=1 FL=1